MRVRQANQMCELDIALIVVGQTLGRPQADDVDTRLQGMAADESADVA